jgi:hypothetical protein
VASQGYLAGVVAGILGAAAVFVSDYSKAGRQAAHLHTRWNPGASPFLSLSRGPGGKPGASLYARKHLSLTGPWRKPGASLYTRMSLSRGTGGKPGASLYTRKRLTVTGRLPSSFAFNVRLRHYGQVPIIRNRLRIGGAGGIRSSVNRSRAEMRAGAHLCPCYAGLPSYTSSIGVPP